MNRLILLAATGLAIAGTSCVHEKSAIGHTPPIQVVQMREQFEMLKSHRGEVLDIREVDGKGLVQVCMGEHGETDMQFAFYPSKEDPVKAFSAVGMKLPSTWKEGDMVPGILAAFSLPEDDVSKTLPLVIHEYFTKFLKRPSTYKIDFKR